jgi:hypothetical protein
MRQYAIFFNVNHSSKEFVMFSESSEKASAG